MKKIQVFFIVVFVIGSLSSLPAFGLTRSSAKFALGEENLGQWKNVLSGAAQAPGPSPDLSHSTLVLAENRTNRPDIFHGFRHYHGGWNITNRHYWGSVGFTGAAAFILGGLWLVSFGLILVIHHCCGWRITIKGEESAYSQRICLVMLIVFTAAAVAGCVLLSVGQDKFNSEALHTLRYVVNQSDYTVQTLRNVTEYLSLAKTIKVAQILLPTNVMDDIDKLNVDLNNAADTLLEKTSENEDKIKKVFHAVRSALITVAALMLLLALVGLVLFILGHQHAIHIFIISGWLLVAVTFILCGVFVILNNAVADTCLAMDEWVENPQAETALSNILPCVDQMTTNHSLTQSKQVINSIVNVVNTYIYTFANIDPSQNDPRYYNQSGPQMPPLCYPFNSQLQESQCGDYEVSLANASAVWQKYTCVVSASGMCMTVGRVTPDTYEQLIAAVTESYALEHYTPPLLSLQNCNFVRETFQNITATYCPPLERNLKVVNAGLGLISVGVLLCLVIWIIAANRPKREEVFGKAKLSLGSKRKGGNEGNNNLSTPNSSVVLSPPASIVSTASGV